MASVNSLLAEESTSRDVVNHCPARVGGERASFSTEVNARFVGGLLRCMASGPMTILRYALLIYVAVGSWFGVYIEFIPSLQSLMPMFACDALNWIPAILFIGDLSVACSGAWLYGSLFACKMVMWMNFLLLGILWCIGLCHKTHCVHLAAPFFVAYGILSVPKLQKIRRDFSKLHSRVLTSGLYLQDIVATVELMSSFLPAEQSKLANIAKDVEKAGVDLRRWSERDLRHFLHSSHTYLTSDTPRSAKTADAELLKIIQHLSSQEDGVLAMQTEDKYGVFATLRSALFYMVRGSPKFFFLLLLAASVYGCIAPLQSYLISQLADCIQNQDRARAPFVMVWYFSTYLLGLVNNGLLVLAFSGIMSRSNAWLQTRIATNLMSMGMEDKSNYSVGSLTTLFASDVTRMQQLFAAACWQMFIPFSQLLVAVLYVCTVNLYIGVLAFASLPLILTSVPQAHSSEAAAAYSRADSNTISAFGNGVACHRLIWTCNSQHKWLSDFLAPLILQQSNTCFFMQCWGGIVQAYVLQLINLFIVVQVTMFAWSGVFDELTVADFVGLVSLFLYICGPSITLGGFYRVATQCAGSAQRIDGFLSFGSYVDSQSKSHVRPLHVKADLVVENLTFYYAGASRPLLSRISFVVHTGEFAAFVGSSGVGKSTILGLLATWLRATIGCISLGEAIVDPSSQDFGREAKRFRDRVAVVLQDPMLFHCSVHDNIKFGAPDSTTRLDVEEVADIAQCTDFITSSLTQSFDTQLGCKDFELSGGQAQRLCIARALCRKPSLLILDEATSALDPHTEEEVIKRIKNLRLTHPGDFNRLIIVSVTHRPATLKYADVVFHVEDGCVRRQTDSH